MFAQSSQELIASSQSVKTEQIGEFKFLAPFPQRTTITTISLLLELQNVI